MATSGMKRYFISNTSCLCNLYLIECFRKCKSKSYLKAILMLVEKEGETYEILEKVFNCFYLREMKLFLKGGENKSFYVSKLGGELVCFLFYIVFHIVYLSLFPHMQ